MNPGILLASDGKPAAHGIPVDDETHVNSPPPPAPGDVDALKLREPNHNFAAFILHKCLHGDFRTGAGWIHGNGSSMRGCWSGADGCYNQNGILLQICCR